MHFDLLRGYIRTQVILPSLCGQHSLSMRSIATENGSDVVTYWLMWSNVPRLGKRAIFETTLCAKYYTFEWSISPQN